MKTQIILTVDRLTDQERTDLRYLLTDALAEFETRRRGNYVKKRYKDTFTGPRAEKRMEAKQQEVERRRDLAKKLKHAAHEMDVIDVRPLIETTD